MTVAYRRQNNNKQTNKNETKKQTKKASKKATNKQNKTNQKNTKKKRKRKKKKKHQKTHGIFEKQEKTLSVCSKECDHEILYVITAENRRPEECIFSPVLPITYIHKRAVLSMHVFCVDAGEPFVS